MKRRIFLLALSLLVAAGSAFAQDAKKMLADLDAQQDFGSKDFTALYTIVSKKPGESDSISQVRMFRRDVKNQFTMLVMLPEVNKGQGYLREDDNVWFFDPTSRKFTFRSIKENIQNSEAKNSDLTKKSIEDDYDIVGTTEGTIGSFPVWIIELKAKTNDVSYERLKYYVRKDRTILLKEEAFSVSGDRLMRTTLFTKYVVIQGYLLPSAILIIDELNRIDKNTPGEQSQVTMTEQSLSDLPPKVFTKAYIEQVNK